MRSVRRRRKGSGCDEESHGESGLKEEDDGNGFEGGKASMKKFGDMDYEEVRTGWGPKAKVG